MLDFYNLLFVYVCIYFEADFNKTFLSVIYDQFKQ